MSSNRRASVPVNALRRSPRRRTKTPSVNEVSKKCKISPRGKRRLEFRQEKPFKGLTFYLDLQGYRKISSLQARIKELGGAIEEFLSKDISCVVTTRKDIDTRCSPRSNSTPSPILSVPSPFPGNTKSSSAKGSAVPSPLSADSCGAEQTGPAVHKHDMRGKALAAQAAITYKYGSSNIMANARNWGVTIMPLEKMLERLEQYRSVEKKPTSKPLVSGRVTKQGVKPKVRKLCAPFIKVEDHSRAYKPLVHELKEWPKIYFDGPLGSCPFDSPKKDLENERQEHAKTKRKTTQEDKNKKKGFCECCCIHYEDLDMHLLSDRHQSFARDSSNYQSLDELINKGPSLQDFLAKMLLKHEQKEKEKQVKDRSESPSSANSPLYQDEEKTPSKKNKNETLPNCQTPPDQTPKDSTGFHTPTNTTPKKSSRSRTPTTSSSPEKKSAADDTPTRVLRRRSREDRMVESRQSRNSPRLSDSSNEKDSKGGDTARGKGLREKRLSSEKTSDESSVKRTTRTKTRSTSPSLVPECSRRGASSPSQEELIGQSTKIKLAEGKKKSLVRNVEKKRADVKTCARQQHSSDESSGKENRDPESIAIEDNVTCSGLRSGAARVTQQPEEGRVEKNDCVETQVDAKKEPEQNVQIGGNGDRDGFREAVANIQKQPEQNSEMESPKRTRFRSATEANLPEHCTDTRQDFEIESPKRKSLRSASKANPLERCSETEDLIATREANVQKEQNVEIESPKRKSLRSAVKTNLPEQSSENKGCGAEPQKGNMQEDSNQDSHVESSKRASLRSATREDISEAQVQETPEQDIEMESPKRKTLRSATKGNIPEPCCQGSSESKNLDSPKTEGKKKRMRSSPVATQPLNDSASTRGLKDSKTALGDQRETMDTVQQDGAVRLTRSRGQSAPTSTTQSYNVSDVTEKGKSEFSSLCRNSTEEEHVERKVRSHDHSVGTSKRESQKSTSLSGANAGEVAKAADEHDAKQSSKCFSCGPDAVPEVTIKLSDCRQLRLTRTRPVLETESDDSETESIQLSSGETLSKRSFSDNALSRGKEDNDNNVSSTSTLEYCPSPASSEKSGLSDETESNRRYSLRKRSEHEDQDTCPRKTRSKNKIPDENSKKGKQDGPQRRRTVSSAYTNVKVKSRSPKKQSQSVTSPKKKAPVKRLRNAGGMKSPFKKSPQGKARIPEDHRSESDSSTFSGSPQSGPISETKSTRASKAHSAVRNLEKSAVVDTEDAKETSLLSVSVVSVGDLSATAVRGSPPRLRPARFTMTGKDTSLSGMKLLDGSPRIKKDFHSVSFLNKHRKQRAGIARLFESDDEEEDFIGFNVPQFDRSFSSEGDLSYKIDSILESMKGDDSHCIIEDDENTTVDEYEAVIMRENIGYETETDIERTEIANEGQCSEKVVEEDQVINQVGATRMTRKRKSNQIDTVEVKRSIWFESQGELRSTAESEDVDDNNDDDDFDEDDDVFSTVADSSDGEDEDEVASPFSISSWGRKRKSEDLQAPEIERPTKRRKSHEGTDTNHSSQSSKAETPIKSGANQEIRSQTDNKYQKSTSFMSRMEELQKSEQTEQDQNLSAKDLYSFWNSEEPVFLTIEERVKLRRIKNNAKKEQDNSQSLRQTKDHRKVDKTELAAKGKTEERLQPLKPLRKRTLKPLKPLSQVSPIRSSSRLSRTHSTPSLNPSSLATPSGKPRRATWIYDASEFTSPPSAAPRFGGNRVTCSTPTSTVRSSKRTLRPLRHSKMAEGSSQWKSRQRDVYAFDE